MFAKILAVLSLVSRIWTAVDAIREHYRQQKAREDLVRAVEKELDAHVEEMRKGMDAEVNAPVTSDVTIDRLQSGRF